MLRFIRDHEEDALWFIAGACMIGIGAIVGMVLADIVVKW